MNPSSLMLLSMLVGFIAVFIFFEERNARALAITIGTIAAIIALVSLGTVLFVPGETQDTVTTDTAITDIYTFSDNAAVNGNNFIVVSDNTYYYYYKTKSGIKQGTIPTNKTSVTFTDETPTLKTTTKTTVRKTHYWWFLEDEDTITDKSYTLFVPEGSISINIAPPQPDSK